MMKLILLGVAGMFIAGAIFGTGSPYVAGGVAVACLGIGAWLQRDDTSLMD